MSEISAVSFAGEIHRVAAALGRVPTAQMVNDLEARTRALAFVDITAGKVVMNDGSTVADFLAAQAAAFPVAASDEATAGSGYVKVVIGGHASHRRADDAMAQIEAGFQAAHDAQVLAEAATWANPWAAGSLNRTRQAILTNKHPARAAQLKAEAGV